MENLDSFIDHLFNQKYHTKQPVYDKEKVREFVDNSLKLFFPQINNQKLKTKDDIFAFAIYLRRKLCGIFEEIAPEKACFEDASQVVSKFMNSLMPIEQKLEEDARAIYEGDPAAVSMEEVISCYPGFFAIAAYRIAHFFYQEGAKIFPRLITEYAHEKTGIDIHPGAKIGRSFCIDHGTGIVIGETTLIGDHVKLYQGVTLGALSVSNDFSNTKRHPTLEDNCVIYSNATILGGKTVIGKGSVIGGNVWLTETVEAGSRVYHQGKVVTKNGVKGSK